jgi:uncharacterized damage-inducible protein DinB
MISQLIHIFKSTIQFIEQSVQDLSEQQMLEQPTGVPNHGMWTLGHIVHSCQGMAIELGAESWLAVNWEAQYGYGSTPSADPDRNLKKAEMLALLQDAVNRLTRILIDAKEDILTQKLPDETFPTMTHLLLQVVVGHTAYHAGQLAVWRRAMGKEPVAVFV